MTLEQQEPQWDFEVLLEQIQLVPREQVDAEIQKTKQRLSQLEHIRKLTAPAAGAEANGNASEDAEEVPLEEAIYELLAQAGELTVNEIAESLGEDARTVGKKVNSCSWFEAPGSGGNRVVSIAHTELDAEESDEAEGDGEEPDVHASELPEVPEAAFTWLEGEIIATIKERGPQVCRTLAKVISLRAGREVNDGQVYRVVYDSDRLTTMGNGKVTFLSEPD